MTTVFPVKYSSSASTIVPEAGAAIGAPAGLGKSVPPWGLLACPLKTLRMPKLPEGPAATGRRIDKPRLDRQPPGWKPFHRHHQLARRRQRRLARAIGGNSNLILSRRRR